MNGVQAHLSRIALAFCFISVTVSIIINTIITNESKPSLLPPLQSQTSFPRGINMIHSVFNCAAAACNTTTVVVAITSGIHESHDLPSRVNHRVVHSGSDDPFRRQSHIPDSLRLLTLYLQPRMRPHSQQLMQCQPLSLYRYPTLRFVSKKARPFFTRALSSTLRFVLDVNSDEASLAEALHLSKVCSSLPKK